SFVVHTGAEGSKVTSEVVGRPDVEVIVSAETWNEIAAGAISPLEAFGRGLMRVRGDVNVAWKVARKLGDKAAGSSRR
ncbi:MAG TPA: SCP2 sterol-binding domain-containing protein, partial [Actinomycetota bacterium]|nr:SCP2 sterol-binding domain-containing protein [Actinomycetota bacterium]